VGRRQSNVGSLMLAIAVGTWTVPAAGRLAPLCPAEATFLGDTMPATICRRNG
jgi:hypothetical protein